MSPGYLDASTSLITHISYYCYYCKWVQRVKTTFIQSVIIFIKCVNWWWRGWWRLVLHSEETRLKLRKRWSRSSCGNKTFIETCSPGIRRVEWHYTGNSELIIVQTCHIIKHCVDWELSGHHVCSFQWLSGGQPAVKVVTAAFIRSICRDDAPEPSPTNNISSEQLKDSDFIICHHKFIHCLIVGAVIKCLLQSILDVVLQDTVSPSSLLRPLWRAAVFRTSWGPWSAPWGTRGSARGSDKHPAFINTELTGGTSPAPPCGQHHTLHPPPARGQSPDGESQMSLFWW